MLMVGWLAVAALLLSQRPAPSVIQGQALFRSLEAHEKAFNDTKTNQAETLGLMTDLFQILDDHEQKFRKGDWLVTGASLSTNASFLSGFQPTIDLLTTNVSTNGWPPVFSNGWNFFVFNPTSAVPVRWVTNFIATNMLSALKKDGTNKVFSNNLVRARGSLAVEIRRLQSALQPIMPTPDNGVLPTLSSDEQGKYYVGTFALMAILALSASHNFYRRALVRELKPGGWAQQHSSVLLWVMFVVGLGVLVVSLWAFSACQDRCARNAYPFFVMGGIMLVGVLGAYLFSWNHQLAPRDAIRAGTDWPRMRDAMMLLCLGCFFSALILTFCIWHSHPVLRTCGTLTVGGSLAVVALCLAQPWLPAWWDFKFRCYDLLLQLAQRAQKEPADLALVGQLAALAKMFLPVGVAGPDYQAMETPFLEQELKRLLHDCRVHFGRVIVLIDDVDVLPGEKHPELLRILRPVSKVRGATFLIAAPLHFFHLYRYASLNDVQSTVQNVIVMGDPKLFRGAEGKEEPFSLKIEALKESLEQLLAANMRIPCSSGTLPGFVKNLAACWVSGENKKRVDDELERCGASKRELLRELDRMLSIPGRQPFADRASTEDQKKWVAKAKADFSAAEREANPDFRREE